MAYTRDDALMLLCEHTPSEALQRHCLAVETCLKYFAQKLGEDVELWSIVGLLHDFDYEQHPEEHPDWGVKFLEEHGWSPVITRAVASHYEFKTGVKPESLLERYLCACDELSGFVLAVAYVRPSKSIHEVEVKSVTKKLKVPAFAAGVNREDVARGAELLGVPLEELVAEVILALRSNAAMLGVAGVQE
jgi:putative nucleotidyltransferase with HDIG domain